MKTFASLVKRNSKLFFKDKGLFFVSLITPLILLVLYITFLGNVYKDAFLQGMAGNQNVPESIINGLVGGQLFSSLLAVCCVTVAFCSNMLMVQDKISGARQDFLIAPLNKTKLALSYYVSTFITTLIICLVAFISCLIYVAVVGWYLTFGSIMLILLDVFLLTMFGTVLSSIVNYFLTSQGQISAVGSIVSSVYGFICGAYMPISNFGEGLKNVVSLLPGTYATSLLRNHTMGGAINKLQSIGVIESEIDKLKDIVDCNIYCFGQKVSEPAMYLILIGAIVVLVGIYITITLKSNKKSKKQK